MHEYEVNQSPEHDIGTLDPNYPRQIGKQVAETDSEDPHKASDTSKALDLWVNRDALERMQMQSF